MRAFFAAHGILVATAAESGDEPLFEVVDEETPTAKDNENASVSERLAMMSVLEKMKAATRGTREGGAILDAILIGSSRPRCQQPQADGPGSGSDHEDGQRG